MSDEQKQPDAVDEAENSAWLIYFDDRDVQAEVFVGDEAENCARARFSELQGS